VKELATLGTYDESSGRPLVTLAKPRCSSVFFRISLFLIIGVIFRRHPRKAH